MLAACGKPADKPSESAASDQSETEAQTAEPTLPPEGGYSMQELCFSRDGKKIYGELYLPEGNGPFPGVVIGHGLELSVEDTRTKSRRSSSERAVRTLSDVELIRIEGAEHGFYDEDQRFAAETAALFIWKLISR